MQGDTIWKVCSECGKDKTAQAFYHTFNERRPYTNICKVCMANKIQEYKNEVGSIKAAVWLVLAENGIPFKDGVWVLVEQLLRKNATLDLFVVYMKCLADELKGEQVLGFWQSDVMLDDILKDEKEEVVTVDEKQLRRIWGDYPLSKLEWLEEEFADYTCNIEDLPNSTAKMYRNLCKANLRLKEANETKEDTKPITDEILKWLKLLGIDKIESESQKSDSLIAFEKAIALIELTKPAECEALEKYKDMCNHEKDKDEMMRCLRNAIAGTKDYPKLTEGD